MIYFNVEIQVTDDTATSAIYARESEADAVTAFHSSMASMRAAVDAGTITECTGMVINSYGGEIEKEHYMLPVEPEPEI